MTYEEWLARAPAECTCHLGHPPCSFCTGVDLEEDEAERDPMARFIEDRRRAARGELPPLQQKELDERRKRLMNQGR